MMGWDGINIEERPLQMLITFWRSCKIAQFLLLYSFWKNANAQCPVLIVAKKCLGLCLLHMAYGIYMVLKIKPPQILRNSNFSLQSPHSEDRLSDWMTGYSYYGDNSGEKKQELGLGLVNQQWICESVEWQDFRNANSKTQQEFWRKLWWNRTRMNHYHSQFSLSS